MITKTNIMMGIATIVVLTLTPSRAPAQNSAPPNQNSQTQNSQTQNPQNLTGCIQRGEAVSAYKIIAKDGGIWNLAGGAKLNLGHYVGQTVTIRGKVVESSEPKPEGKAPEVNVRGIVNVDKITVVSTSCVNSN